MVVFKTELSKLFQIFTMCAKKNVNHNEMYGYEFITTASSVSSGVEWNMR